MAPVLQEPSPVNQHQRRPEDEEFAQEVLAGNFNVVLHSIRALSDAHEYDKTVLRAEIERLRLKYGEECDESIDNPKSFWCDAALKSSRYVEMEEGEALGVQHDHAAAIRAREEDKLKKALSHCESSSSRRLKSVLEPIEQTRLMKFLLGPFDLLMAVIIALNAVSMVVQLEFKGREVGASLGLLPNDGSWLRAEIACRYVELVFAVIFLVELVFRVAILRTAYFYDPVHGIQMLNMFDLLIVLVTSVDVFSSDLNNEALAQLRLVRVGRAVRGLRVVRIMYLFSTLRVLMRTLIYSLMAFFWSMILLKLCMFMGTVFLTQTLQGHILDPSLDFDTRMWLFRHYGSSSRAFYTMFEITFSGGWPNFARRVVEDVHPMYAIFFMVYAAGVVFAVTRIITALFLKDTLAVAARDANIMIEAQMKARSRYISQLHNIFVQADKSGDGMISWDEFQHVLSNTKVHGLFAHLELDVFEISGLFNLLDNGDGQITYGEFIQGIMRLKGQARAFDVIKISSDCDNLLARCDELQISFDRVEQALARIA